MGSYRKKRSSFEIQLMRIKSNAMEIYISLGVQRTNYSCIVASLEKGMQESEREKCIDATECLQMISNAVPAAAPGSLCLNQFGAARLFSKLHRRRICRERERERIQFGNLCCCSGWQRETNRINKTKENEEFFYTLLVILYPPAQF
jgi:hypothetical protein